MADQRHPPIVWVRVTKTRPCPVCRKADWCTYSADGRVAACMRVADGSSRPTGNGGYLHKLGAGPMKAANGRPGPNRRRDRPEGNPGTIGSQASPVADGAGDADWPALAARYAAALPPPARRRLARTLGLPPTALDRFPSVGVRADDPHGECTTWPEASPAGEVIGINRRWAAGTGPVVDGTRRDKMMVRGGRRGLTIPAGCLDGVPADATLYVVEGLTDCAALTAAGLACVGRPSANGGAALIAAFARAAGPARPVVVVGENDRKADGLWPGRAGAAAVAARVAGLTGRAVPVAMPPAGAKDVREWLTHADRGDAPWGERGRRLAALLAADGHAPPPQPPAVPGGPSGPPPTPRDAPDNPHRLAEAYLRQIDPAGGPRTFRCRAGEFVEWRGGAYRPLADEEVRARLTEFVRADFVRAWEREWAAWAAAPGRDPRAEPAVRKVGVRLLADVLNAVKSVVRLPADLAPPCWIDGATGPDPRAVVALPNGLLDVPTGTLLPPTPLFFTANAAAFDYAPDPPAPRAWLAFLGQLWPDDPESVECLRQWFGYLLTADTGYQKLLLLVGPKRAGKGTIVRVLKGLVGERNFGSPTLHALTTEFGLSPLLHKSVAVIPDARFTGRPEAAGVVVERLLSITGEDTLDVNRKFLPIVSARLTARFVIVSNELPRLGDASGALAGRMILLRLSRSFYGAEDPGLTAALLAELPGILRWAVGGWASLHARGRFTQPASGAELRDEMDDLSSPVGAFVRERCVVGPGERAAVDDLFGEWRLWCERQGRREPGHVHTFSRDLHAAVPGLRTRRPKHNGERWREFEGIRLRRPGDADEPPRDVAADARTERPGVARGPQGSAGSAVPAFARGVNSTPRATGPPASAGHPPHPVGDTDERSADPADPADPPAALPCGPSAAPGRLFDNDINPMPD